MDIGRIRGSTRALGAPRGWDPARDGHCGSLPIRDELHGSLPAMVSAWFPTVEELQRLQEGAPIYLTVVGQVHPPVALQVGEVDHDESWPPRPVG